MSDESAAESALSRWHASHTRVRRAKRDRDVPALIRLLDEPTGLLDEKGRRLPDVREAALRALGKVGDGRAVEPLAGLLDDRRTDVAAAIALGRIGDERAIPALLDVLGDQDEYAARLVQESPSWLQFLRHPIAEAFYDDHDQQVRTKAPSSLASLRAREVVPLIVKLLGHEHPWIRAWRPSSPRALAIPRRSHPCARPSDARHCDGADASARHDASSNGRLPPSSRRYRGTWLGQCSGRSPDGPRDVNGISSRRGSECGREEALDHGVDLLRNLELVKVPGSDSDPHLQVRLDCTQPDGVGIRVQS